MKILGLDLSTNTGWAVLSPTGLARLSGVWHLSGGTCLGERFEDFRIRLNSVILAHGPDAIVYEKAHHRGMAATRSALGLEGIMHMVAWCHAIPCFGVHSATLKKWATKNGRAGKGEMISAAERLSGFAIGDDNQADAVCLASWGGEHIGLRRGTVCLNELSGKKRTETKNKKGK